MQRIFVFFVLAAVLIQLAFGANTCPYAYASDGTIYNLNSFARASYPFINGRYTYNISICDNSDSNSGVCQTWGPGPVNSRCFGSVRSRDVIGLDGGAGVQIIYKGDVCGDFSPSAPRASVVTLLCDSAAPAGKIRWMSMNGATDSEPAIMYFNGTFNCDISSGQGSCLNLRAPDGSEYDLSSYMKKTYEAKIYVPHLPPQFSYKFSVCGGIKDTCGSGACSGFGSGSVCQKTIKTGAENCFGKYDSLTWVQPLNNGQGVTITYYDGDQCVSCGPNGRRTVLQLTCNKDNSEDLSIMDIEPDSSSRVLYINATIGCNISDRQSSRHNSKSHTVIQYYSHSDNCNSTDNAYFISVDRNSSECVPGCTKQGDRFIRTECDTDLLLPRTASWIEQINYGNKNSCEEPKSAVYLRSDTCSRIFGYNFQECNADAVYLYQCNNFDCSDCDVASKTETNKCINGAKYRCVTDNNRVGLVHRNPLF